MIRFFLLLLLMCLHVAVSADEDEILFNRVNLQASAQKDIPNDKMLVIMSIEHQGDKASSASNDVNRDMDWALLQLRQAKGIKARTQSYQTYPVYNKQSIVAWRAVQQLRMESTNIDALTDMVGSLQKKLMVKEMSFLPSQDARREFENELITEAIRSFYRRVEIVRFEMEAKNVRIIEMNINTSGGHQVPVHREMAMLRSMDISSQPAVESGTSTIQVTINGSVQFY